MNININPNSELHQSIVNVPDMVQVPEMWVDQARQFQQAMMRYTCAIREVKTKLEVLNDELSVKNQPVFFSDSKKPIRVEVQIRTIAMDFWASLDHQLKYKKSFIDDNGEISEELKQCAEVIAGTDVKMLEIRKKIEAQGVTVRRD